MPEGKQNAEKQLLTSPGADSNLAPAPTAASREPSNNQNSDPWITLAGMLKESIVVESGTKRAAIEADSRIQIKELEVKETRHGLDHRRELITQCTGVVIVLFALGVATWTLVKGDVRLAAEILVVLLTSGGSYAVGKNRARKSDTEDRDSGA